MKRKGIRDDDYVFGSKTSKKLKIYSESEEDEE